MSRARSPWRQRSMARPGAEPCTAYLCDRCVARFSSEEAALDFLDGVLEQIC